MAFEWCVVRVPVIAGKLRGAVMADARWPKGSLIKVAFTDGDEGLQARVFAAGKEWLTRTGADLLFERIAKPEQADVRISFSLKGSWSVLGRYAAEQMGVTMNFGWLHPGSSTEELREVVLHEFGHMLGFIHEHQNPDGGLRWNRDAVIASLSQPPNSWSVEEIERNVLNQEDPRDLIGTPFDPQSIMLYPFPAEWNENGIATAANKDLSPNDIALARDIYT
ncbi:MAG: M12 family metallopeptidase [Polyangiaceae bacterium]